MTAHSVNDWTKPVRPAGLGSILNSPWLVPAFLIITVALASLTAYDALDNLRDRWISDEDHGHGFPVLALVALILWKRWGTLHALSNDIRWPGIVLVIVAQAITILSVFGESYYIEQVSFVLTLLGLLLTVFGLGAIRQLGPLAALLILTIPLPYLIQTILTVKLQLMSTDIGVAVIRFLGIPVFVEGNIIDLGRQKLQVAEACSGLRYLLPLTCLSFIFGFMYRAPLWKRAIVVISAVPITLLTNGLRLAAIAVLVNKFGPQMAEGVIHQLEGWVLFVVAGLFFAFEVLVLERFSLANLHLDSILAGEQNPSLDYDKPVFLKASAGAAALMCTAVLGLTVSVAWAHNSVPPPERQTFSSFPHEIDDWIGRETRFDAGTLSSLKASDYYIADYSQPGTTGPVNFFVAYYASLTKDGAIHSPRVCLPGSGWEFASFDERDFATLAPGMPGRFNRAIIQKGESQILMYYWIQQRQRRTASEFEAKYYLLLDNLTQGRRDGALVRLYTPVIGKGEQAVKVADERLSAFAKAALPRARSYLP